MYVALLGYLDRASVGLVEVAEKRRRILDPVADFISARRRGEEVAELTFICTHNSRRSQMGQLWAAAAAAYYGIGGVRSYSGGTVATEFDARAVGAIERSGFAVLRGDGANPCYQVSFDVDALVMECFSKTYDDPVNPSKGFVAMMTCSEADAACPVVLGSALRASVAYEDPKSADDTPGEVAAYDERCLQIATEMLYLFSRVA